MVESCTFTPQDNTIRTQMEAGAAKVRRRFTRVPEDVTFSLTLDRPQVEVLQDFVAITCADVLPFNWVDFRRPLTADNVAVYRFKNRPRLTPLGAGYWRADLELELISKPVQGTFPIGLLLPDGSELTT